MNLIIFIEYSIFTNKYFCICISLHNKYGSIYWHYIDLTAIYSKIILKYCDIIWTFIIFSFKKQI